MFAFIAPILIFIAFLLLLLATLSVPIIKTIYLFSISTGINILGSVSASAYVRFGVWGYCTSPTDVSLGSFTHDTVGQCTKPHLGYTFDSTVAQVLHAQNLNDTIRKASTAALVLHPIACGLVFLTFLVSLFILRLGNNGTSRLPSFLTLGVGLLASLLTTVVFLIDVIVPAVVRHKIQDETDDSVHLNYGNVPWMVLGAAIALWFAMVGACAGVCACGARRKGARY